VAGYDSLSFFFTLINIHEALKVMLIDTTLLGIMGSILQALANQNIEKLLVLFI
jgi:hypothetical protein